MATCLRVDRKETHLLTLGRRGLPRKETWQRHDKKQSQLQPYIKAFPTPRALKKTPLQKNHTFITETQTSIPWHLHLV